MCPSPLKLDFDWSERASIDVSGDGMDVIDITSDGEDDVSEVEAEAAADSGGHPKVRLPMVLSFAHVCVSLAGSEE